MTHLSSKSARKPHLNRKGERQSFADWDGTQAEVSMHIWSDFLLITIEGLVNIAYSLNKKSSKSMSKLVMFWKDSRRIGRIINPKRKWVHILWSSVALLSRSSTSPKTVWAPLTACYQITVSKRSNKLGTQMPHPKKITIVATKKRFLEVRTQTWWCLSF